MKPPIYDSYSIIYRTFWLVIRCCLSATKIPVPYDTTGRKHTFCDSREIQGEMLEGKAMVKETDMPVKMQFQAMACASQALDLYDVSDCVSIAAHIKREFDKMYGGGWQCVVGSNFGCFFTHTQGTFIYFAVESLNFLIFKGASS